MLMSLTFAAEWLNVDECVVSYSDIFYEDTPVKCLMASKSDIAITYDPNWLDIWSKRFDDPLSDAETFKIDEMSNLVEIGFKARSLAEIQGQYMGLLKFSPNGWKIVEEVSSKVARSTFEKMHMTGLLQRIIEQKSCPISAIASYHEWGEIDSISDLAAYTDLSNF